MNRKPLTQKQQAIMKEFYSISPGKAVFKKSERDSLWRQATKRQTDLDFEGLKVKCPALEHQIRRSYESGHNIQSAVFSECVYAQTLANMIGLHRFVNCYEEERFFPKSVESLLNDYHLQPRYVYSTEDKGRMLIQAGGCDGIDSALISVQETVVYMIEFKEPGAKTSEPDLPKYKEDGILVVTDEWLSQYPQFGEMLREQVGLNFFDVMGSNVNNFSKKSIETAVSNNYTGEKKTADVICTEDKKGFLVMLPTDQVSEWADIEGEIRPAGRNHYAVWTPNALRRFLIEKGAVINENTVSVPKKNLGKRKQRGGNGALSGYKINPLFFIGVKDCREEGGEIVFELTKTQQLNPTIAGKMFFKTLQHEDVKKYYGF